MIFDFRKKGDAMRYSFKSVVRLMILPFGILLVAGCSSVTTDQPLPRMSGTFEQGLFEGVWMANDQILMVQFSSDGIARVAGLEWKDDEFQLERAELILSGGDDLKVASVRAQEDGEWLDQYFFVQYEFTQQGDLVLRLPNVDFFDEAVSDGRLEGFVDRGEYGRDIRVGASPEVFLEFLKGQDPSVIFGVGDPVVLKRVCGGDS